MNVHLRAFTLIGLSVVALTSCTETRAADAPTAAERDRIAGEIKQIVVGATDLSKPDPVPRMMGLYPTSGPVISANSGHVTTTRDSLEAGVRSFWDNVGRRMVRPQWVWDQMHVEVLSRDAAVLTGAYHIPHFTPAGRPHIIAGAWTMVFARRGGRWVVVQEHLSDVPQAALEGQP